VASSDTSLTPGQALQTVILGPAGVSGPSAVVSATDLFSLPELKTELRGFTIMTSVVGTIAPDSIGVSLTNSEVLVSRNYIISSATGVMIVQSGTNSPTPTLESNGIIGNTVGILVEDQGTQSFKNNLPVRIANNTISLNETGILLRSQSLRPTVANIFNNIVATNFLVQANGQRTGAGIRAETPNKWALFGNMFYNNGPSSVLMTDDVVGVGGSFNTNIGATPDANGNFGGNPFFANPRDPRPAPTGQGPNRFVIDANFDLTVNSAAIDNAIDNLGTVRDFRDRTRVDIPNRGFAGGGRGAVDVGAFEYNGGNGIPAIGSTGLVLGNGGSTTTPTIPGGPDRPPGTSLPPPAQPGTTPLTRRQQLLAKLRARNTTPTPAPAPARPPAQAGKPSWFLNRRFTGRG
jgi:hypothetical protein